MLTRGRRFTSLAVGPSGARFARGALRETGAFGAKGAFLKEKDRDGLDTDGARGAFETRGTLGTGR